MDLDGVGLVFSLWFAALCVIFTPLFGSSQPDRADFRGCSPLDCLAAPGPGNTPGVQLPPPDHATATSWVEAHLADLTETPAAASSLRGGQAEADRRLAALDITGYAARRNEVRPLDARGATQLSPWIRHGLLSLVEVWDAVADAPGRDRQKYRDELLWQEYARHWYARLRERTRHGVRARLAGGSGEGWVHGLPCVDACVTELHTDGWLVNQSRMWLASHWAIREGKDWRLGEDEFFRHLLDGSRAANRLGWQWTVGAGSSKPYGFSRRQVEKRAPGLCGSCPHRDACPIEDWPDDPSLDPIERPVALRRADDPTADAGPDAVLRTGGDPDAVWLTAESLGDADPALAAHPDLPAVFVFDAPLLRRLRLSAKRLIFLAECLAELSERRSVEVYRGAPTEVLAGRALAVTHAPVPGYARRAAALRPVAEYPWPWLTRPTGGSVQSFSAWRKAQRV